MCRLLHVTCNIKQQLQTWTSSSVCSSPLILIQADWLVPLPQEMLVGLLLMPLMPIDLQKVANKLDNMQFFQCETEDPGTLYIIKLKKLIPKRVRENLNPRHPCMMYLQHV